MIAASLCTGHRTKMLDFLRRAFGPPVHVARRPRASASTPSRPRPGRDSYERVVADIERALSARLRSGPRVGADDDHGAEPALPELKSWDEYVAHGFNSIFLAVDRPFTDSRCARQASSLPDRPRSRLLQGRSGPRHRSGTAVGPRSWR